MLIQQQITAQEFDAIAKLPENAERMLELIGGEIVEVPSNPYSSQIAGIIFGELYIFLKGKNLGYLTGEAGGYMVAGERYAPDVAFIGKGKQLATQGYNPDPPDLAIEVEFPVSYESQRRLLTKVTNYLAVGTVVWVVLPEAKEVRVYAPGKPEKALRLGDVLQGEPLLPGFSLPIQDIFPQDEEGA